MTPPLAKAGFVSLRCDSAILVRSQSSARPDWMTVCIPRLQLLPYYWNGRMCFVALGSGYKRNFAACFDARLHRICSLGLSPPDGAQSHKMSVLSFWKESSHLLVRLHRPRSNSQRGCATSPITGSRAMPLSDQTTFVQGRVRLQYSLAP